VTTETPGEPLSGADRKTQPPATNGTAASRPLDDLLPLVYNELRKVAARKLRSERSGHTLCTTALVHEAWIELSKFSRIKWQSRSHVLALAAQAMRRILIDYAEARRRQKRGGGQHIVPLDEDAIAIVTERAEALIALEAALQRLATLNERHARIVECRFYGGMSVQETAEALAISPATVKRDWAIARAWLNRELAQ
jgi:RNA polymerase sigma-70 factor, ECF subfamily